MRGLILALTLAVAAAGCVVTEPLPQGDPPTAPAFRALRGQALPPPEQPAAAPVNAPPEGVGPGGIDFGAWRSADPEAYSTSFSAQMRTRLAGKSAEQISADLAANGFACAPRGDSAVLECRIEIMEQHCARDWYVAVEPGKAEPIAGFDVMCLGAL